MKRIAAMSQRQIDELREKRMKAGWETYGDAHLRRYGLLDVLEEVVDAQNILDLTMIRVGRSGVTNEGEIYDRISLAFRALDGVIKIIRRADEIIPEEACFEEEVNRVGFDKRGELDCF